MEDALLAALRRHKPDSSSPVDQMVSECKKYVQGHTRPVAELNGHLSQSAAEETLVLSLAKTKQALDIQVSVTTA